jgi:hypothetical protein
MFWGHSEGVSGRYPLEIALEGHDPSELFYVFWQLWRAGCTTRGSTNPNNAFGLSSLENRPCMASMMWAPITALVQKAVEIDF